MKVINRYMNNLWCISIFMRYKKLQHFHIKYYIFRVHSIKSNETYFPKKMFSKTVKILKILLTN